MTTLNTVCILEDGVRVSISLELEGSRTFSLAGTPGESAPTGQRPAGSPSTVTERQTRRAGGGRAGRGPPGGSESSSPWPLS